MRRRVLPSDLAPPGRPPAGARLAVARALVAPVALALALVLAPGGGLASPAAAQDTTRLARVPVGDEGWNTERVRELVERARARRRQPLADSTLRAYRADVTGHIYFFIDREVEPEPVLLRADQVALELYWGQPDRVKQVIRGMRSEEQFPIKDFRYYLDRYTVIQNGFDDVIRVGEGQDVRNVIHPLSMDGDFIYEFRLADSTTIRLPGEPDPIRVYEVQVRPRDFDVPAIVGSLFVERARGDLVRLAFTFTPASYLDRRNERVEVMLENALWDGRYWLPREQRLLVRREIPEIDLDVGTVIRAALRVEDYELNVDLPPGFFGGAEVVMAAGPRRLAGYDFDEGLFDGLDDVGLEGAEPGTLDAVDVEAITGRIIRERFLRGVPRIRFFAPSVSDALRYTRAEGLVTGGGAAFGVGRSQLYAYGGWAWGAREPLARVGWRPAGPDPTPRFFAEAYLNRPLPLGLRSATSGVLASASAALLGTDYRDELPATGAAVGWRWGTTRSRNTLSLAFERVEPAEQALRHAPGDEERAFRPVPAGARADQGSLTWEGEQRTTLGSASLFLRPRLQAGAVTSAFTADAEDTGPFARARLHVDARWTDDRRRLGIEGRFTAGMSVGRALPHHIWYIGGPGTLPGHPFHAFGGTTAAVLGVDIWREVVPRILRVRASAGLGMTGGEAPFQPGASRLGDPAPDADALVALDPWTPALTDGVAASVAVGVGLLDGVVRLDLAFPTDSWDGVLILSVDPDLWSFL